MTTRSTVGRVCACALIVLVSACGNASRTPAGETRDASDTQDAPSTSRTVPAQGGGTAAPQPKTSEVAMKPPGKLTAPLLSSDVLVYSQNSLPKATIAKIKGLQGVDAVEPFSMGSLFIDERQLTYAAVDPATFRRYTPQGTAQTTAVWDRVADGEIAVEPAIGRRLQSKDGFLTLGNESDARRIHVGAYAPLLPATVARRIDAVVNEKWADQLGMRRDNAMLVAMGSTSPQSVRKKLQQYAGSKASVQILGPDLDINATQTAVLTGGSVAAAVGSFSYRANPDGTVAPDPAWVAAKIRTEEMPIIGRVTGNVVMLPQLRGALNAVLSAWSKIYHYDGCYVPRFIARDPSKGLSFHTFGTAIDLNASDNQRGGAGKMDRQVVAIFKKWGFAWGGDWHYTDPMHFELAQLKTAR